MRAPGSLLFLVVIVPLVPLYAGCPVSPVQKTFTCRSDDDCVEGWTCRETGSGRVCHDGAAAPADAGLVIPRDGGQDGERTDGGAVDADSDGGEPAHDAGTRADGGDAGPSDADGGAADAGALVDGGAPPTDGGVAEDAGESAGEDAGQDAGEDAGAGQPPWVHPASPFRVALVVNNAGLTNALSAFPALVILNASVLGDGAVDQDGDDLRFFDDTGQPLPHEVERWDDGGNSYVWLRLPAVPAAPEQMRVWLYFGDASASSTADAPAVWLDYEAVYHCADEVEASGKHPDAEPVGSVSTADAAIGAGAFFGGSGDFARLGSDVDMARNASAITLSAWALLEKHTTPGTSLVTLSIDGQGTPTGSSRANILVSDNGRVSVVARAVDAVSPSSNAASAAGVIPLGQWRHITGVIDFSAGTIRVFVDGERVAQNLSANFPAASTPDTPSTRAILGIDDDEHDWDLDGALDEVRIERVERGSGWIRLQHRSMTGGLFTFGAPEARPEP